MRYMCDVKLIIISKMIVIENNIYYTTTVFPRLDDPPTFFWV